MALMKWLLVIATCGAVGGVGVLGGAACGGSVASVGDGGANDASSGDSQTHDAPPQPDGPKPVDCAAMAAKLDALRTEAKTCCPFCNSLQCQNVVKDTCCPFSITAPSAPAFTQLLQEYEAQCPQACPATPCPKVPSGICKPIDPQNPSSRGTCQ